MYDIGENSKQCVLLTRETREPDLFKPFYTYIHIYTRTYVLRYRFLVDEPGEVGRGVGLPGGAHGLQGLPNLVLLLDAGQPGLVVR